MWLACASINIKQFNLFQYITTDELFESRCKRDKGVTYQKESNLIDYVANGVSQYVYIRNNFPRKQPHKLRTVNTYH